MLSRPALGDSIGRSGMNTSHDTIINAADAALCPDGDMTDVTFSPAPQQGESLTENVTSAAPRRALTAAERKRGQRERERMRANAATLMFERPDWSLFMDLDTLGQKAGCQSHQIGALVLRELADNALDAGAQVSMTFDDGTWTITDDGPGLDPADVPILFSVNRPLRSSKLIRLPLRGMLGNGLRVAVGAVAASGGTLVVETRGQRLTLVPDRLTGLTRVAAADAVPPRPGLIVSISLPGLGTVRAGHLAKRTIAVAGVGHHYLGGTSPWWYSRADLARLLRAATQVTTSVRTLSQLFGSEIADDRPASQLTEAEVDALLQQLRQVSKPIPPEQMGDIGGAAIPAMGYAKVGRTVPFPGGAEVPAVVEAWATAERAEERGRGSVTITLLINRTESLAELTGASYAGAIFLRGCGLHHEIDGPKTARYTITLSIITPHIDLASDGKAPQLLPFRHGIVEAVGKAAQRAYRKLEHPERGVSLKDAASAVMADAYRSASGGGRYPANARQIMYAARPAMLRATGRDALDDAYFTQTLLPDYLEQHADTTGDWDVVFDARGALVEPHTEREVALSTIEVREYLGDRPPIRGAITVATSGGRFRTRGPTHRYRAVLFIEKEGFGPLLAAGDIANRFDVAIMSTKGMSVVAARHLLDRLTPQIDQVLVLHDFDVAGFSIFGTLSTDNRRYRFSNKVPITDIGLRLIHVEEMGLQSEPVTSSGDWSARARTLRTHGATEAEIAFLRSRRVELNAMTADQFLAFVERQLVACGVEKVVPAADMIEAHARQLLREQVAQREIAKLTDRIEATAAETMLPGDLRDRVIGALRSDPGLAWDGALAAILRGHG